MITGLVLLLISLNSISNTLDINSGKFERIPFQNKETRFELHTDLKDIDIEITDDYSWIRINNSFSLPKVDIRLSSRANYTYKYAKKEYYSQSTLVTKYTHFFISPFLSNEIFVYEKEKLIGKITISIDEISKTYLIDKSCNSVDIRVENKNKEPLLIGCSFYKKENQKLLKIQFMHKNSKLLKESYLDNNAILEYDKNDISFKIQASYKSEIKNFVFALGLGPYALHTSLESEDKDAISAAIMLYSKYTFTEDTSLRAFSASIFDVSSFHNVGMYLANDFAHLMDSDLIFTSLLGIQYLDYRFNSSSEKYKSPLYPQGIEFTYKNLFKSNSYIISGGIFINPTSTNEYQNTWLRWGDKYFYEINYINWSSDEFKANMWGLSLIIPFR